MLFELLNQDFNRGFRPRTFDLDVSKKEGKILVEAHLPKFSKEDLSVDLKGLNLVITAKKSEKEDKEYLFKESSSEVSRSIYLGSDVNLNSIEAKFEKGVLTVSFDKKDSSIKIL